MSKFIEIFKSKAHQKDITAADMIALCIYKTITVKTENKAEVLKYFLKKTFTKGNIKPHRPHPYYAISIASGRLKFQSRSGKIWNIKDKCWQDTNGKILKNEITGILNDEEIMMFRELLEQITPEYVRTL